MPSSLLCSSLSADFATEQFARRPRVFDTMAQAFVLQSVVLHAGPDHLARVRDGRREHFRHIRAKQVLGGALWK